VFVKDLVREICVVHGEVSSKTVQLLAFNSVLLSSSSSSWLLSRRSRQRELLSASVLSVCVSVSLSVGKMQKNALFSKTKQFRAIVSIDDL